MAVGGFGAGGCCVGCNVRCAMVCWCWVLGTTDSKSINVFALRREIFVPEGSKILIKDFMTLELLCIDDTRSAN